MYICPLCHCAYLLADPARAVIRGNKTYRSASFWYTYSSLWKSIYQSFYDNCASWVYRINAICFLPRYMKPSIWIVLDLACVSNEITRIHLHLPRAKLCQGLVFVMEICFILYRLMARSYGVLHQPAVPPITFPQVLIIYAIGYN